MIKRLCLFIGLLLLVGCSDESWRTNDVSDMLPELDFDLVNEDSEAVDETAYADKATLVYFGFTNCPDVCPIMLATVASAIRQLEEGDRDNLQVLFISVDPERDTPSVLQTYTDAFGPEFIGLTGDRADIDAVANRYRITYEYGEKDEHGNYEVTHSSAVFAFDRHGKAKFMIRDSDSMTSIVADLKNLASGS
ncbi:MAG: SCO family protein [Halomonas sp.]|uniref:SCO family protein n=1 Tax=Halomonas sp. TaxID=1486246 RepID=UPI003F9048B6